MNIISMDEKISTPSQSPIERYRCPSRHYPTKFTLSYYLHNKPSLSQLFVSFFGSVTDLLKNSLHEILNAEFGSKLEPPTKILVGSLESQS